MIEKRCGNCQWFIAEPNTQLDPRSPAAILARREGLSTSQAGGSTRPVYGKCKAEYTDQEGQLQRWDFGMVSTQTCQAKDDQGEFLFTPKLNQ